MPWDWYLVLLWITQAQGSYSEGFCGLVRIFYPLHGQYCGFQSVSVSRVTRHIQSSFCRS